MARDFNFTEVEKDFYNGKVIVMDADNERQMITLPNEDCVAIRNLSERFEGEIVYGVLRKIPEGLGWFMCHPVHGPVGTILVCEDILNTV